MNCNRSLLSNFTPTGSCIENNNPGFREKKFITFCQQNSIEKFGNVICITGDPFCQRGCKLGMKNKSLIYK